MGILDILALNHCATQHVSFTLYFLRPFMPRQFNAARQAQTHDIPHICNNRLRRARRGGSVVVERGRDSQWALNRNHRNCQAGKRNAAGIGAYESEILPGSRHGVSETEIKALRNETYLLGEIPALG